MERIIIKNFGPIKDVDLQINDFMIFIGPQASGKSTIAKLIYFYKSLFQEIGSFIVNSVVNENFSKSSEQLLEGGNAKNCIFSYFVRMFPEAQGYKEMEVQFHYGDNFSILVKLDKEDAVKVTLPSSFETEFEEVLLRSKETYNILYNYNKSKSIISAIEIIESNIDKFLINHLKDISRTRENLFIPAGRGYISMISNQIFDLKTENLDYLIKEFASQIKSIKDNYLIETGSFRTYRKNTEFDYLLQSLQTKILKGKYLYLSQNERIGLEIEDGSFIPLDKSSSGQQEAIWITQYIISKIYKHSLIQTFTVIEEPEAHLYPESQKNIAELIALFANAGKLAFAGSNRVVITTHSPYILAAVNNLLYANKVGKTHEKEVSEIVDKNLWLDFKRVDAYFVGGEGNEGRIKRIMDDELEMIESQYLDNASQIINQEFDLIYVLED